MSRVMTTPLLGAILALALAAPLAAGAQAKPAPKPPDAKAAAPAPKPAAKQKLAVLDIRPLGTEASRAELLSEIALTEASSFRNFEVIGKSDIATILGFEKQRQVMGCSEDSGCLAELGGALGVDLIMVGSLGRVGALYRLDMKLVDSKKAKVRGRVGVNVEGQEEKIVAATQRAVRELLDPDAKLRLSAAPPPEQLDLSAPAAKPSKALGWTAVGAGVLSVGLGAYAVYSGASAKSSYDKASGMLEGGVLKVDASAPAYNQAISDADSAKKAAYVSGAAAVGCAAVAGVLGYMSYKQTGEVGPFRF